MQENYKHTQNSDKIHKKGATKRCKTRGKKTAEKHKMAA